MLGCQIELIATRQLAPQRGLRIPQAIRSRADIKVRVVAAAARAQLHQPGAVVIALQHRYRAAIDIDLVQLQRHHNVQIEIAIGVGCSFVKRNAIQRGRHIAAMPAAPKAAQHQRIGHATELVVVHMHAGHLAPQRLHFRPGLRPQFITPQLGDRENALRLIQCLAFDLRLHPHLRHRRSGILFALRQSLPHHQPRAAQAQHRPLCRSPQRLLTSCLSFLIHAPERASFMPHQPVLPA